MKLKVTAVDEHNARSAGYAAVERAVRYCEGEGFNYDESEDVVESVFVEGTELWRA